MTLLRTLFVSSRPLSWINTAYPFGAAYLFSTHRLDAQFWVGTLFFLIPYNLLMYGINDVFDYESDLRNPRKGGIEGALLDPKWHRLTLWTSVLSCLPFVAHFVFYGDLFSSLWLAFILFMVIAYSAKGLRFKEVPPHQLPRGEATISSVPSVTSSSSQSGGTPLSSSICPSRLAKSSAKNWVNLLKHQI